MNRPKNPPYLIVTGDLVETGGMDRANLALAEHLLSRNRELHIVAHRVDKRLIAAGATFHHVVKPMGSYLAGAPLLDAVGRRWARRIAARGGRVVVNGGNCAWSDVNWVHYVHAAYRPSKRSLVHRMHVRAEQRVVSRARTVIVNSERTRRDVQLIRGANRPGVHTVYYGTDAGKFSLVTPDDRRQARQALGIDEDRPLALFIGALGDNRKGFDTLARSWRELCADPAWDVALLVVGAGHESIAALDLPSVRVLGFRRDVPAILAACDVLVHPSRYEAYGLGVHEAVCRGLPVIVAGDAGVVEQLDALPAELILAQADDSARLTDAFRWWRSRMRSTEATMRPIADRLRSRSWDTMATEIIDAIEQP